MTTDRDPPTTDKRTNPRRGPERARDPCGSRVSSNRVKMVNVCDNRVSPGPACSSAFVYTLVIDHDVTAYRRPGNAPWFHTKTRAHEPPRKRSGKAATANLYSGNRALVSPAKFAEPLSFGPWPMACDEGPRPHPVAKNWKGRWPDPLAVGAHRARRALGPSPGPCW